MLTALMAFVRRHALVAALGIAALVFLASGRVTVTAAFASIDVDLLLVLFALLVAVEILRESGWLDLAVTAAVARFDTTRGFALATLALTGLLAALVTNDVALFVVIPFTVAAHRISDFDLEDLVILEIVATNLLGCLTPLGNPQNLFLFHRSGWSASRFVLAMAPLVALGAAALLAASFLLGRSRPLAARPPPVVKQNDPAAVAGAVTFVLVLLEIARVTGGWPAAVAAALAAALYLRKPFDVSIVPLFLFAFVVVEGLRTFHLHASAGYWSAVGISQLISNVPATIFLTPFAGGDWRTLLWGVNVGGCGTIIASLANLLGWRIYVRESGREPRFFWRLTAINFAFLAVVGSGGWLLLRL